MESSSVHHYWLRDRRHAIRGLIQLEFNCGYSLQLNSRHHCVNSSTVSNCSKNKTWNSSRSSPYSVSFSVQLKGGSSAALHTITTSIAMRTDIVRRFELDQLLSKASAQIPKEKHSEHSEPIFGILLLIVILKRMVPKISTKK